MKRILAAILCALLLCAAALADEECFYAPEYLPDCYRAVCEGPAYVFCRSDCPVYDAPDGRRRDVLLTGIPVYVMQRDEPGWAMIAYDPSAGWNDGYPDPYRDDTQTGYVRTRDLIVSFWYEDAYTVMPARPGERVNLRARPDPSSVSYGKYYSGTIVTRLGGARNGYCKVRVGHAEGYMDERYLNIGPTVRDAELRTLTVRNKSGSGANIRKQPSGRSEIIATAENGETVTVIAVRSDGWMQVIFRAEVGYTRADLLEGSGDRFFRFNR